MPDGEAAAGAEGPGPLDPGVEQVASAADLAAAAAAPSLSGSGNATAPPGTCKYCSGDHLSSLCDGVNVVCRDCNLMGHFSGSDKCINPICNHCKRGAHVGRPCISVGRPPRPPRVCDICQGGHRTYMCTNQKCRGCGEVGHWQSQCLVDPECSVCYNKHTVDQCPFAEPWHNAANWQDHDSDDPNPTDQGPDQAMGQTSPAGMEDVASPPGMDVPVPDSPMSELSARFMTPSPAPPHSPADDDRAPPSAPDLQPASGLGPAPSSPAALLLPDPGLLLPDPGLLPFPMSATSHHSPGPAVPDLSATTPLDARDGVAMPPGQSGCSGGGPSSYSSSPGPPHRGKPDSDPADQQPAKRHKTTERGEGPPPG